MDTISIEDDFGEEIGTITVEEGLGEQKVSVEFSFTAPEKQTGAFKYEDLKSKVASIHDEYSS